ncbi:hypothetical protein C7974DRAFT_85407 [Boeremia exigua]|uniref:uncharacterized protein n=1 Tax=Boeremia exigua TaxID=749465 RepID=UPI001E8D76EF|nr:uncharacterized protein C7974DRAFT_85407 [Boeremia exigua]KAH6611825.1 hypothetical protein C7974DRAFT_85407 [Boeremia exigua]
MASRLLFPVVGWYGYGSSSAGYDSLWGWTASRHGDLAGACHATCRLLTCGCRCNLVMFALMEFAGRSAPVCGAGWFAAGDRRSELTSNKHRRCSNQTCRTPGRRHYWLAPSRRTSGDGCRAACVCWHRSEVLEARGRHLLLAKFHHRHDGGEHRACCNDSVRVQLSIVARGRRRRSGLLMQHADGGRAYGQASSHAVDCARARSPCPRPLLQNQTEPGSRDRISYLCWPSSRVVVMWWCCGVVVVWRRCGAKSYATTILTITNMKTKARGTRSCTYIG